MAPRKIRKSNDTPERLDARIAKVRRASAKDVGSLPRADRGESLAARTDGWGSMLTGIGTERDRRQSHSILVGRHSYEELRALYRFDDMIARAVDRPADDMTREGWDIHVGDGDEEMSDAIEKKGEEIDVLGSVSQAIKKARFSGGCGLFLGVVDGAADTSIPLDESRVRSLDFLATFDAREIYPASYYADPLSPKYGLPATYYIRPMIGVGSSVFDMRGPGQRQASGNKPAAAMRLVHESRIVRFEGVITDRIQQRETLGWGDSVIERILSACRDFGVSYENAAALILDFAQGVFKMEGLAELVAAGDTATIQERMTLIERQRSVLRAVLLDKEEEFDRKPTPVAGLSDLLGALALRWAAAADVPLTLLLGQSPAGLNATGDSDVRNYYDRRKSDQVTNLLPRLRKIYRLIMLSKAGPTRGVEPKKWTISFRPLWTPTEKEEAEIYKLRSEGDAANVNSGILMPEEVAIARFGGSTYGKTIKIDPSPREKFLKANPLPEKPEEPDPADPANPKAPAKGEEK
jgi:phage-related protein (TIGR01555 family)